MSAKFDIYFSGVILAGFNPAEVRQKVGHIFKANDALLNKLFSGSPVRVKAGVDQDTAIKYKLTFRKAGASIDIKACRENHSIPQTKPAPTAKPVVNKASFGIDEPSPQAMPTASGLHTQGTKPGESQLEFERGLVAMAIPDTEFDLSPVGVVLDQKQSDESEVIASTINLELNPANTGSLIDCEIAENIQPLPDINHLDLL